ncbi:MAG: hypothetical protein JWQ35_92 [Bacteriovoracaceae bacterium]|nr:hypothetical protein [Bacteriovoracaceae bacterium]
MQRGLSILVALYFPSELLAISRFAGPWWRLSSQVWWNIGVFGILFACILFFVLRFNKKLIKKDKSYEADSKIKIKKKGTPPPNVFQMVDGNSPKKVPNFSAPSEVKVTEKMSLQISDLISSIKTLPSVETLPVSEEDTQKKTLKALEDSGLMNAFAETMVSEPKVDPSDAGNYCKMSIDATLLFDDEDKLPPTE